MAKYAHTGSGGQAIPHAWITLRNPPSLGPTTTPILPDTDNRVARRARAKAERNRAKKEGKT